MSSKSLVTAPEQLKLKLEIVAEREVDGVGMGVLGDGNTFLTVSGLARMCGVDKASIIRITAAWQESPLKPRERKIRELVSAQGADDSICFIATMKNGVINHAIPSFVCMAVLEYYAFEVKGEYEQAAKNYRLLARKGFNDFIYAQVGYNPTGEAGVAWQQFHDRVSLSYHTVPDGYFSVFKEISNIFVTLIRNGAQLGNKFIPDISVGLHWGKYWTKENLDIIYGDRLKYEHNYPQYFPQAASNPQQPYCYPDEALGEFRKWVREHYIPKHLPGYIDQKVREKQIPAPAARRALEAFAPKAIARRR
ncbi:hypothetical protein [Methylosinus sp. R-45379]|uniref:hypothetical protein n=1 Tax=Methylosinus sp. R-45379 TaxID=980563 RepID=UPI000A05E4B6|nr:hypothetical protein [Methylosinus sp. R-45379]